MYEVGEILINILFIRWDGLIFYFIVVLGVIKIIFDIDIIKENNILL